MNAIGADIFYPRICRRQQYSEKKDVGFYHYQHYRQEIAEDSFHRCAHCDAHERDIGGREFMELDHFRPKSVKEFEHLANDPRNLNYTCRCCNGLKSDHWPARETTGTFVGNEGFVDPFEVDRLDYFGVETDGSLRAKQAPAAYVIGLLALNRPFLRQLRELRLIKKQLAILLAEQESRWEALAEGKPGIDAQDVGRRLLEMRNLFKRIICCIP